MTETFTQPELKPVVDVKVAVPLVLPPPEERERLKHTKKIDANDIAAEFGPQGLFNATVTAIDEAPVVFRSKSRLMSLRDMRALYPRLREPVIEGLLRRGEIMNIIGDTKSGKSWASLDLALTVIQGAMWFGRFKTRPGRVLMIDNELHRETIAHRTKLAAESRALKIDLDYMDEMIDYIPLRGKSVDIKALAEEIKYVQPRDYILVVCDAMYRMMPEKTDERDNGQMTNIYNQIDLYAEQLDCSICLIHHTTKGTQAGKKITDVGSGAGSISRATDTHLILRQLRTEPDVVRVDTAVRSFPQIAPFGLRRKFPTWEIAKDVDLEDLEGGIGERTTTNPAVRDANHQKLLDAILKEKPMSVKKIHWMSCQMQLGLSFGTVRNLVTTNWLPNGKLVIMTEQAGSKAAIYGAPGGARNENSNAQAQSADHASKTAPAPAAPEENPLPPLEEIADILNGENSAPEFDDFISDTDTVE